MNASEDKGFHHAVVKLDGNETLLSKAQYEAMPLKDRVKLILSGDVKFFDVLDRVLPSSQALIKSGKR
ncbi:MAG: hypothetical protein ACAI38_12630 [Myxococcota bacterium]